MLNERGRERRAHHERTSQAKMRMKQRANVLMLNGAKKSSGDREDPNKWGDFESTFQKGPLQKHLRLKEIPINIWVFFIRVVWGKKSNSKYFVLLIHINLIPHES